MQDNQPRKKLMAPLAKKWSARLVIGGWNAIHPVGVPHGGGVPHGDGLVQVVIKSLVGLALLVVLTGAVTLRADDPPTKDAPKKDSLTKPEVAIVDGFALPAGAIHRFGNRQLRHPDGIIAAVVSLDGKLFATASHLSVVVWDLKTLAAKRVFPGINFNNYGHGNRGGHLSFLPDSSAVLVAVRPADRPVIRVEGPTDLAQVWDIESGKMRYSLKGQWDYEASAWVTTGGKEIALVGRGGPGAAIRFFDIKGGKEAHTVETPHLYSTPWVAPGGEALVYQGENGEGLGVLDVRTGKEIHRVPSGKVVEAALSRDGRLLAFTDDAGKVRVHDVEAKNEIYSFDHPEKQKPGPMAVSADRQTLYFSSNHGRLFRWDLKARRKGPDFGNRHNFWNLSNITLSPDESVLYSTSYDHLIKRWDLKTGKELPLPEGYTTRTTLVTSPDGKHVIVSDHEGQVDFWDLATGKRVKQIQKSHLGGINCLGLSPDGRWLAGGRTSQDVRLFDLSTEKNVRDMYLADNSDATKYGDQVQRVAFDASGKVMVSASEKTGVTAWEISSGKKIWNTPATGPLMAVDPRGRWIAGGGGYAGGRDVRWALVDAKSGEIIGRADVEPTEILAELNNYPYPPYVGDLGFLPDGSRLLTAHYDGTLRVWDPETRRKVRQWKTHRIGGMAVLACSPDGNWLAVGGSDASLNVWELATGKVAFKLEGHHSGVTQVEFTRDGRKLISSADLAPVLWDLCPKDLPAVDGPADSTWEALQSDDPAKAYRLQWALAKQVTTAVKLFGEKVNPAEQTIERARFDKLVGNMDSPQFRAREEAEKELVKAGYRVPVEWLRKAMADAKSDELRTRLTRVLTQREKPAPEEWRLSRAVKTLELSATDEARQLLKAWSAAPEGSLLAVEAKGALQRIAK
jgi:WD40 repeat protein